MLLARVITAAAIIVVIVPVLILGKLEGTVALVAVFCAAAMWELSGNLEAIKKTLARALTLVVGFAVIAGFYFLPPRAALAVVVGCPLVVLLLHLFLYNVIENTVESVIQMIFVLAYAVIPLSHAILLGRLDLGIVWIFFVLTVVSLGDAGAYFTGKYLGRHRFSKNVSPNKTIEGLLGGVAGNLVGMFALKALVPDLCPLRVLVPLTLVLAVVAPLGDLCASALKRRMQIKDFGSLLPGHGGVMDRADALIFAFPATYHFLLVAGLTVPL
jgi:phosphatidate cytidylyltransferase